MSMTKEVFSWGKFSSFYIRVIVSPYFAFRVDLPDSNGRTALHIAANLGNKVFVFLWCFQTSQKYDTGHVDNQSRKSGDAQPAASEKPSFDSLRLKGGSTNPFGCKGE